MELGFDSAQRVANSVNHRRASRATWWFAQMRRAVDAAAVWQPAAPEARPEQTWFKDKRLAGGIELPATTHQVCE
jgi:hypothetical protein